jgi:phosphatidylglycerophosphate synthase
MPSAVNVAGEVASAATALAGLLLVFLGLISNSYGAYQAQERGTVRARYQMRAWFAFVGFVLALLSALLALVGKWLANDCAAIVALAVLAVSVVWAFFAGLLSVREIK